MVLHFGLLKITFFAEGKNRAASPLPEIAPATVPFEPTRPPKLYT
jgi:hypothetical protein